jgi:putative ABC transport system permease protein
MFRPRWRKVLADLWDNKARTLLVIASITVGVFAIGMIAANYVIISADMMSSYLATNPPNIALIISPMPPEELQIARRMAGVAEVVGSRPVIARVLGQPGAAQQIKLLAPADWAAWTVGALTPVAGAQTPKDRQVILERKTLEALGLHVGDELEIELGDGATRRLPVVGVAQNPSASYDLILGDLFGYITFDTLEWLHEPLTINQIAATVSEEPNNAAHIDRVATALKERLKDAGYQIFYTDLQRREDHPLRSIIQALLAVLAFLGALIAFLSGSLIANTMSALLNQHLRQIGVMKLVGARGAQVAGMYLALIMTFGLIAYALAIPTAAWAANALSAYVADLLNFSLTGYRIVPLAVVLQGVIALLVPPIAGLAPVLGGARVSVKQALTATGLSETSRRGAAKRKRQMRLPRWLSRPLLLSIRNTFRRKRRLALTIFTLMLGGAVFIAVFNVQVSLDLKVLELTHYFLADVNLELARPYRIEAVEQQLLHIPDVERVEVWATTRAEWLAEPGANPENVTMIAPPAGSALLQPVLVQGRWLLPGDENAIAINETFLQDVPGLKPGDRLRLKVNGKENDWVVVGVFQFGAMDRRMAYANYDYLSSLLNGRAQASVYRLVTVDHSLSGQQRIALEVDQQLRALGYEVSSVEAGGALAAHTSDLLGILTTVLLVMALLTALVGSIGLAGTMSMNVMERTREIGVLRAIGAHNGIISRLVIVEGWIIGAISFVFAALLSFPISQALSEVISRAIFHGPANFAFTAKGFALWFVVALTLSTVASLMPARNASRLTIREVLAYE